MPKKLKAEKKTTAELLLAIKIAIDRKNYFFTTHAKQRAKQRNIDEFEVFTILKGKSKFHEPKKDKYNEEFASWNYTIRGNTVDKENIRIIVSFDEDSLLIVTVINL